MSSASHTNTRTQHANSHTYTYKERQLLSDFLCFSSFSVSFLLLSRRFVLNFPIFCHAARAFLFYDLSAIFQCTLFKLNPARTLLHPRHTERKKHPVSISHHLPHCVRILYLFAPTDGFSLLISLVSLITLGFAFAFRVEKVNCWLN